MLEIIHALKIDLLFHHANTRELYYFFMKNLHLFTTKISTIAFYMLNHTNAHASYE